MKKDDKQNSNSGGLSLLLTKCILFPRLNPYVDEIIEIMRDVSLFINQRVIHTWEMRFFGLLRSE
jgi:hypothetical protein